MLARTRIFAVLPLFAVVACGATEKAPFSMERASVASQSYQGASPSSPVAIARDAVSNTEDYKDYGVNAPVSTEKDHLSTFAFDVHTESYAISRRKINEGALPPVSAVRAEEFVNSFDYNYPAATGSPLAVHMAAAPSPFAAGHHLVRIALQAARVTRENRKPVHLVYLVDVSGSMNASDKLPLAQKSLRILTSTLKTGDTVALSTYARAVREVLPPTGIEYKERIFAAISDLNASGSTGMASGIELAYKLAERSFVSEHVNHVVVLSDGDANVGPTTHTEILKIIETHKQKGITLSTVGLGAGNYKDTMMEQLADKGDGNYSYIDSEAQAHRVFERDVNGLLQTVAKDVKVQVDFAPEVVKEYRLIGYENRDVADKDFRNDKVDGGEVGAGHSVTALYDVILKKTGVSPLTVHVRFKSPDGHAPAEEKAFAMPKEAISASFVEAPRDLRFATSVVAFAEVLRESPYASGISLEQVESIARESSWGTPDQSEFAELVRRAARMKPKGGVALAK